MLIQIKFVVTLRCLKIRVIQACTHYLEDTTYQIKIEVNLESKFYVHATVCHTGLHELLDKLALACRAFRRRARNSKFKGQASLYLNGSIPFSVQVHYPISKLQTINHGGQRGHKTSNHNHYRPITADPSK